MALSENAPNEADKGALRFNGVLTAEDMTINCLDVGIKEVGCLTCTLGEMKDVE